MKICVDGKRLTSREAEIAQVAVRCYREGICFESDYVYRSGYPFTIMWFDGDMNCYVVDNNPTNAWNRYVHRKETENNE